MSKSRIRIGPALALAVLTVTGITFAAETTDPKFAESPVATNVYRIQPGDVLQIAVWKEQDLQGEILVRPDGGISFPLVGDLQAGGVTVADLTATFKQKLTRLIPDPEVVIAIKQIGGNRIYVIGKVNRPGEFTFSKSLDVMQALSMAGGATPFAALNDIRILRREAGQLHALEFRYSEVERGRDLGQNVLLISGDTVVVP